MPFFDEFFLKNAHFWTRKVHLSLESPERKRIAEFGIVNKIRFVLKIPVRNDFFDVKNTLHRERFPFSGDLYGLPYRCQFLFFNAFPASHLVWDYNDSMFESLFATVFVVKPPHALEFGKGNPLDDPLLTHFLFSVILTPVEQQRRCGLLIEESTASFFFIYAVHENKPLTFYTTMELKLGKKRWIVLFLSLIAISVLGLFITEPPALWGTEEVTIAGAELLNQADIAWMIAATCLVMLMTPGLSFFYGGMVRAKNVISTMLQSVLAMGLISIVWVVVGFSLAFGKSVGITIGDTFYGFFGDPRTFFMFQNVGASPLGIEGLELTIPLALFALFQLKFAIITPALIAGAFAERVHFSGYLIFMLLFSLFIYAPLAHCTWHPDGFLSSVLGLQDFAGGIVVHASSGIAALAGAIYLGRRQHQGKHVPANMPIVILGACLLWFGWFGFNGGSALGATSDAVKAFLNTNTACAAAMLAWILFDTVRGHKPSGMGVAVGIVVGLVAITPCAGWVTVGQSFFIGTLTAICCNIAVHWKNKSSVDDALDVFPTHGVGGIIGTILTAIFVHGLLAGEYMNFFNHLLAIVLVFVYTFVGSYLLYWITDMMVNMRVSPESENIGLDRSQHGEAYTIMEDDVMFDRK